jgi:hypothetical protein
MGLRGFSAGKGLPTGRAAYASKPSTCRRSRWTAAPEAPDLGPAVPQVGPVAPRHRTASGPLPSGSRSPLSPITPLPGPAGCGRQAPAGHTPGASTFRSGRVSRRQDGSGSSGWDLDALGGPGAAGEERRSPGRAQEPPGGSASSSSLSLVQETDHASLQMDQAGRGERAGGGALTADPGGRAHGCHPPRSSVGQLQAFQGAMRVSLAGRGLATWQEGACGSDGEPARHVVGGWAHGRTGLIGHGWCATRAQQPWACAGSPRRAANDQSTPRRPVAGVER